jgi:hypothetical protein
MTMDHGAAKFRGGALFAGSSAAIWLVALVASAAPYLPADDAQVLERLPGGTAAQLRELRAMKAASSETPKDLARAIALATADIRASRVEGDPRFLGYAQAALAPWWKDAAAPTPVLLLRATILQSSHQFDPALTDLGRGAGARTRTSAGFAHARDGAHRDGPLSRRAQRLHRLAGDRSGHLPIVCIAAIDSVTGNAAPHTKRCAGRCATRSRIDSAGRTWGETLLGEIAHRRGDPAAEGHFRARLPASATSTCSALQRLAARPGTRRRSRRARWQADASIALLLRLALAQRHAKMPRAAASTAMLRARFDASLARRDTSHQRDNARFELAPGRQSSPGARRSRSTTGKCNASPPICGSSPEAAASDRQTPLRSASSSNGSLNRARVSRCGRARRREDAGQMKRVCALREVRARARDPRAYVAATLVIGAVLPAGFAHAHKPSDSYLTLKVNAERIDGQWDIALRDLDYAITLDADQNGEITWGEVKAKHAQIAAYALARLRLGPAAAPCPVQGARATDRQPQRRRLFGAALHRDVRGRAEDARHRLRTCCSIWTAASGLLRLEYEGETRAGIFSVDEHEQQFKLARLIEREQFVDYGKEGVWHIWTGFDHVLFCFSLLLPAVLVRASTRKRRWRRRRASRPRSGMSSKSSPRSRSRTRSRCRSPRSASWRCRRAGSSRRSRCRLCWPRSTTSGRSSTKSDG